MQTSALLNVREAAAWLRIGERKAMRQFGVRLPPVLAADENTELGGGQNRLHIFVTVL